MLSVENLTSAYGRIEALHGVSIEVGAGEIVTLVGANGAGKTTLLRAISGVQPITAGSIRFDGKPIERLPSHDRVAARHHPGSGRAAAVCAFDGRRQFEARRVVAPWSRCDPRDRARLRAVSDARRDAEHAGRGAVGRPTTDARDRAGVDGDPSAVAARRAVDGPCSDPGRSDSRDRSTGSSATGLPSCWSSRMRVRRWRSPTAPMCSKPAGSRRAEPPPKCKSMSGCGRPISASRPPA